MQRRAFVTGLSAAAAFPLAARAGEAGRLPIVANLNIVVPLGKITMPDPSWPPVRALVLGLRDLGWIDGGNVRIELLSMEGDVKRAPAMLADLVARNVDVIVPSAALWLFKVVQQMTTTIPVVAIFADDPVADGFVTSLARPGGNFTGIKNEAGVKLTAKRLQLFRQLVPDVSRVAFLGTREAWEFYAKNADASETLPIFAEVNSPDQFDAAFATVLRERADALLASSGAVNYGSKARIIAFAAEHRLPASYFYREAVEDGGLMSYGTNTQAQYRQLAAITDRILKGAKPADIPVEQPTRFELVINQKTADALGLTIPPLLRARADEIIE